MQRNRQVVTHGGLEDRFVGRMTEGGAGLRQHADGYDPGVSRPVLDLAGGALGVVEGDVDDAPPAPVLVVVIQPDVNQEGVLGLAVGEAGLRVHLAHQQLVQHGKVDLGVADQLVQGELRVRARRAAAGRGGVAAHGRVVLRPRRLVVPGLGSLPGRVHARAPGLGSVLGQHLVRRGHRMDVGVDDADRHLPGMGVRLRLSVHRYHCATSKVARFTDHGTGSAIRGATSRANVSITSMTRLWTGPRG
jgi:hypothetical protein